MENKKTVSDLIRTEYTNWSNEKPIIICAPTGTGKTHFILNTLLPYAKKQGEKICFMSNRKILKAQVEQKIPDEFKDFIITKNYQEGNFDNEALYWVLDEAHYFLADNSFNVQISTLASILSDNYKNHICIFMTATPEYLFLFLTQIFRQATRLPEPYFLDEYQDTADHDTSQFQSATALLKYKEIEPSLFSNYISEVSQEERCYIYDMERLQRHRKYYFFNQMESYYSAFDEVKSRCHIYEFPPDYSYIDPCYFCNNNDLVQLVKESPAYEKWMIFVSAKDDGRNLQMTLIKAGVHSTAYLDALHKDPAGKIARQLIIDEETFPFKVLICTKVLDNGININDPSVKHIVIYRTDKTTFLQMLGRKRINCQSQERITLYLKHESCKGMQKYFNQKVLDIVKFLRLFKHQKSPHGDSRDPSKEPKLLKTAGRFGQQFIQEGHIDSHYQSFLLRSYPATIKESVRNMARSSLSDINMRERLPLEYFRINNAGKRKLTYEYYQLMAMFERYENRLLEEPDADDTIWLEEQLGWIDKTFDPSCWDSIVFGKQPFARTQVEEFLESHLGILTKEYRDIFVHLIANYVKTIRPYPKEASSKFSFRTVQLILEKYDFPYTLSKKRKSINGKDAYWWIIDRKIENNHPQP